jgi:hypothetical protein
LFLNKKESPVTLPDIATARGDCGEIISYTSPSMVISSTLRAIKKKPIDVEIRAPG